MDDPQEEGERDRKKKAQKTIDEPRITFYSTFTFYTGLGSIGNSYTAQW